MRLNSRLCNKNDFPGNGAKICKACRGAYKLNNLNTLVIKY